TSSASTHCAALGGRTGNVNAMARGTSSDDTTTLLDLADAQAGKPTISSGPVISHQRFRSHGGRECFRDCYQSTPGGCQNESQSPSIERLGKRLDPGMTDWYLSC